MSERPSPPVAWRFRGFSRKFPADDSKRPSSSYRRVPVARPRSSELDKRRQTPGRRGSTVGRRACEGDRPAPVSSPQSWAFSWRCPRVRGPGARWRCAGCSRRKARTTTSRIRCWRISEARSSDGGADFADAAWQWDDLRTLLERCAPLWPSLKMTTDDRWKFGRRWCFRISKVNVVYFGRAKNFASVYQTFSANCLHGSMLRWKLRCGDVRAGPNPKFYFTDGCTAVILLITGISYLFWFSQTVFVSASLSLISFKLPR